MKQLLILSSLMIFILLTISGLCVAGDLHGVPRYPISVLKSPALGSCEISKVSEKDMLLLLKRRNQWVEVNHKNKKGWVALKWIVLLGDISILPENKPPQPEL